MTPNGSEALPALPKDWAWCRLEDLAANVPNAITDGPFGSNLKTEHYTDRGPRVIRLQNIGQGEFIDHKAHISDEHFQRLRKHKALPGDVVIAALGETLPRAALVPDGLGPAIVKADCPRLRVHPAINAAYVVAALNSPVSRYQAPNVHGVGRPRMNLKQIKDLQIPLPPRPVQDAIVYALDRLQSRCRIGEIEFGEARKLADRFKRALLHVMIEEARADETATEVDLGSVCEIRSGVGFPKHLQGRPTGDLPFAKVRDISEAWGRGDRYLRGASHYISTGEAAALRATPLPKGTVVMAKIGEAVRLNRRVIVSQPTIVDNNVMGWVPRAQTVDPLFLFYFSLNVDLATLSQATAVPSVRKSNVAQIRFPLPALSRQRELVMHLERELDREESLRRAIVGGLESVARLRAAIVNAAVGGKLVSSAPSAERAEVLLERMRAERPAQRQAKRPHAPTGVK